MYIVRTFFLAVLSALALGPAPTIMHGTDTDPASALGLPLVSEYTLPGRLEPAVLQECLRAAVLAYEWTLLRHEPGRIEASLTSRKVEGRLVLLWDERSVRFHAEGYKLDENGQRQGRRGIDRWVASVRKAAEGNVRRELGIHR